MKVIHSIFFSATCLLLVNTGFSQRPKRSAKDSFKKLEWVVGTWDRTNAKPGRTGREHWIKVSEDLLQGYGVSMKGNDTLFVEDVKLLIKDNEIYYVADIKENPNPVYFKLTKIESDEFVCENPDHDFPKKISYRLEGNSLKAITSGDGRENEFIFIRQK